MPALLQSIPLNFRFYLCGYLATRKLCKVYFRFQCLIVVLACPIFIYFLEIIEMDFNYLNIDVLSYYSGDIDKVKTKFNKMYNVLYL